MKRLLVYLAVFLVALFCTTPAFATITLNKFRHTESTPAVSSLSTGAWNLPSGDLVACVVRHNATNALSQKITDTASNTYAFLTQAQATGGDSIEIWYAKNTVSNSSN